uniref:Spermatosis associated 19 n=1 Tax=Ursus americanus TaxID=9643 RepID=A0A452R3I4_URSAM
MIITTWIVYILARKCAGFPFPPKISSDVEVVESEAVSVVQHWLKKTEEEASQDIKEKMSTNCPPTHGQDVHVTRDVVKHHLSKSDLLANQSHEVLEERTRIHCGEEGTNPPPSGFLANTNSTAILLQRCWLLWLRNFSALLWGLEGIFLLS